jgi:hypothetical protein
MRRLALLAGAVLFGCGDDADAAADHGGSGSEATGAHESVGPSTQADTSSDAAGEGEPCTLPGMDDWEFEFVAEAAHYHDGFADEAAIAMRGDTPGFVIRSDRRLLFVERTADAWTIADTYGIGYDTYIDPPTLRFGSDGEPIILVARGGSWPETMVVRRTSGAWEAEEVFGDQHASSLALAPDGSPELGVAFFNDVAHARHDGTAWVIETVASAMTGRGGTVGLAAVSLATDDAGARHIAYRSSADSTYYATQTADGWQSELVGESGNALGTDIAIASDGTIHIMQATSDGSVAVATRAAGGGAWTQVVAGSGEIAGAELLTDELGEVALVWRTEDDAWHLAAGDGTDAQSFTGPVGHAAITSDRVHVVWFVQNGLPWWDICHATHAR